MKTTMTIVALREGDDPNDVIKKHETAAPDDDTGAMPIDGVEVWSDGTRTGCMLDLSKFQGVARVLIYVPGYRVGR